MKVKVMVVDDSRFVYEEIKYLLMDSNFEIAGYCKDGEEAISAYDKLQPDVVTMDIILPGIDGLDASRAIMSKWPDARIVVVSSLAYDETVKAAKEIGAYGFVFKPFDKQQMLDVLTKTMAGEKQI